MSSRATQLLEVNDRKVPVSNLDKILYPSGFTKGQVINYYIHVADYLLPHFEGRPVTLKRYPNGVEAKHFYEKDAPKFTPEWVHRFPVPRRAPASRPDICYVVIDDLPALVWCANLASIELHPFLHRVPKLDQPTAIVFDLDPGEGADVLKCGEVAFLLRAKLEANGLQSWPKVSGSKGIQIYAPLNTPLTYADTQPFARQLAEELEREHPDLIVSAMAKALRSRKVFIDWSQNSDFKTTVGVYSLRAASPQPFVSLPVSWEELRKAIDARDGARLYLNPDAVISRLKKTGDLFQPVLAMRQKLPKRRASTAGRTGHQG
jgi:bifunctional non-homologous end joining protein LigD